MTYKPSALLNPEHRDHEQLAPSRTMLQMSLLVLVVFSANYARTFLSPLQETMRTVLTLSDNEVALLQGPALAFPVVAAAIPLGLLIDRLSRVRLLFGLAIGYATGSILTAVASDFTELLLARCLVGLTSNATFTCALSLAADLFASNRRGRATMAISISQIVGMALVFALGGVLLSVSGPGVKGLRGAMLWLAAPLVLAAALPLTMREPARGEIQKQATTTREAWLELWQYRGVFIPLLSGMALLEMALGAALVWGGPVLARELSLPPERVGGIMAAGLLISGTIGPFLGGMLADFCHRTGGPKMTLAAVTVLPVSTLPACLFAFLHQDVVVSTLLIIFITLICAGCVMGTTLFTVLIPNEIRGLCMAIMGGACILFGVGLAPISVSATSKLLGGPAALGKALALVATADIVLGSVAFLVGRAHVREHAP